MRAFSTARWPGLSLALARAHLLVADGGQLLIGQLHQRADICAQVGLASNEEDPCTGAKVQDLRFPLRRQKAADQYMRDMCPNWTCALRRPDLLQTAVHCVGAADVETQQHCVRVTVAQGSDVIVVRRTWIKRKSKLSTQVVKKTTQKKKAAVRHFKPALFIAKRRS